MASRSGFVYVPTTPGELLDRLCILRLKAEKRPGDASVAALLDALAPCAAALDLGGGGVVAIIDELRAVNESLWDAETRLRALMATTEGTADIAKTAVDIARLNDQRGVLKRRLDSVLGGAHSEPKFY